MQRLSHTIKNIPMNSFVHGGLIKSFRNKSLQLDVVQMVTASSSLVNIDSTVQYGQYGGCTVPVRYGTVRYNNSSPYRITKNRNNVCSNIRDIYICQISYYGILSLLSDWSPGCDGHVDILLMLGFAPGFHDWLERAFLGPLQPYPRQGARSSPRHNCSATAGPSYLIFPRDWMP